MLQAILSRLERVTGPDAQGWYTALCPCHNDRDHPNLRIDPNGGFFCQACGEKGSLSKLAQKLGLDEFNKEMPMGKIVEIEAEAITLLGERGLTNETIAHFSIEPDIEKQAWCYPVLYQGKVVATRYKAFPNRKGSRYWWAEHGVTFQVYGLDDVKDEREVWLVEGEPDYWVMYQVGLPAITLLAGAGSIPSGTVELLKEADIDKLNIVYDSDDAGRKGAQRVARVLQSEGFEVSIRELPDHLGEGGDITDLYRKLGYDDTKFREVMQSLRTVQLAQTTQAAGLHVVSLSDLLSEPTNEIPWLINGILPSNGVLFIAGEPGTGKTWFILTLAIDIAEGHTFLDSFATKQGSVLIIDEESGQNRLRFRIRRLLGSELTELPIHLACMSGIKLEETWWFDSLCQKIEEINPIVVIIDSLVRIHRGDENSTQDMSRVFTKLSEIRQRFGCAFILTHHLRKKGQLKGLNTIDQRMRGSSDISAYADSILGLEKIDDRLVLRQFKNRDGDEAKPLALAIEDTDEETTRLVVVAEIDEEADKRGQARELVIEALGNGVCLREDLVALAIEAGISERTLADALGDLVKSGKVTKGKLGRKTTYAIVQ